ncbi:MAG TPA: hypothetical protein DIC34_05545 [Treponema sp.]|nr:MAG: hypothetical protein A2Y36_11790 [Treponema sp. GWA1_62_8]OHE65715.1 MAG: hypothetical protein A2001_14965 [Treponema sp. GWC1_61_84]HCM26001.1 hypothetical protein [Treponema sp.]
MHLSHKKFPEATYRYSSEYDRSEHLIAIDPIYREKPLIAAMPMYGKTCRETKELLSDFREVYFHRMVSYPPTGVRGEVDPSFTLWKVARTLAGKAKVWGGHGTCLHTAIYMAVLMGAGEINLIGCGHGMYKPETEHFAAVESEHHEMRPGYRSFSDPVEHVPLIEQTLALADACRAHGIRFEWYRTFTAAMDDKIVIDPEWLAEQKVRSERKFGLARTLYWAFAKRPLNRVINLF